MGPDAPNASVGEGARTRTPNVKTPDTTCPSPESACQRTVYGPLGSCGKEPSRTRPVLRTRVTPTLPVEEYRWIDPGTALTYWSKRRERVGGDERKRSRNPGDACSSVACASACPGNRRAVPAATRIRSFLTGVGFPPRKAAPETTNAIVIPRRHQSLRTLPRTSASSVAPPSISTCAQTPCASMCSVELVKKTITGHRSTPSANAMPGHRYARQARCRQTSGPTTASASRQRPRIRKPVANSQWTCSAGGCTILLEVLQ